MRTRSKSGRSTVLPAAESALGVAVVYVPGLEPLLEAEPELVPVLEIEPQTLWVENPGGDEPYRFERGAIDRLAALPQVKLIHGVGFPVGGTRPPDPRSIPPLGAMIEALDAPYASEHLGFNVARGGGGEFCTGFMLPPRQTAAGVRAAAASVRALAEALPVPLAVETGVNYLQPRADELPDGVFVGEVANRADCGILLDLHNLYVNECNGRPPALEVVEDIPLERVWEVHVAGGFELRGYRLDAHSGAIPQALVELAADVIPRLPNLRTLTFEIGPDYLPHLGLDGIRAQLELLSDLWASRGTVTSRSARPRAAQIRDVDPSPDALSPDAWEATLGALVTGQAPDAGPDDELEQDPGVAVLQELVASMRRGMVADGLGFTIRLLTASEGVEAVRARLSEYWRHRPPALFSATEAEGFAEFLADQEPAVRYLDEILAYDRALLRARRLGAPVEVRFLHDPVTLLSAIADGRLPSDAAQGEYVFTVEL